MPFTLNAGRCDSIVFCDAGAEHKSGRTTLDGRVADKGPTGELRTVAELGVTHVYLI